MTHSLYDIGYVTYHVARRSNRHAAAVMNGLKFCFDDLIDDIQVKHDLKTLLEVSKM